MSELLFSSHSPAVYWLLSIVTIACAAGIPGAVMLVDQVLASGPVWQRSGEVCDWPRVVAWAGMALLLGAFVALVLLCRTLASA
ncbi:hypothetical protein [Caballeronia telluris]|jgi:hypothetical protein|uniref:Uncharacterized protein n=1 Tax=Caballeronia telluris TaxID=326475 RepID=A0A158HN65_9BURK|nr:hypothetical protein [Caballeronia telluris]SAL45828.1 hypothetical protein AWB66_02495 [Caballeronia telluris]